jgi:hypothetical protein
VTTSLETLYLLVTQPSRAFRTALDVRPAGLAAAVFVWALVARTVGSMVHTGGGLGALLFWLASSGFLALILLFAGTALIHLVADFLGGRGSGSALFLALALSFLPMVFLPATAIAGEVPYLVGRLVILVWQVSLMVVAIREVYRFETLRALATFLTPLLGLLLAGVLVILVSLAGLAFYLKAVLATVAG